MNLTTISFGLHFPDDDSPFIQGTFLQDSHGRGDVAGIYGDKPYESLNELLTVAGWTRETMDNFIKKIRFITNT